MFLHNSPVMIHPNMILHPSYSSMQFRPYPCLHYMTHRFLMMFSSMSMYMSLAHLLPHLLFILYTILIHLVLLPLLSLLRCHTVRSFAHSMSLRINLDMYILPITLTPSHMFTPANMGLAHSLHFMLQM